jgi:hypothetical protein
VTDEGGSEPEEASAPHAGEVDALRDALLNTLIEFPLCIHVDGEGLADTIWEYEKAAARAHPAVAEVVREAMARLRG